LREYDFYIFDMDNTLVDSSRGYDGAIAEAFGRLGVRGGAGEYGDYIQRSLRDMYDERVGEGRCSYGEFCELFSSAYDRHAPGSSRLFPDARRCIESLRLAGKAMGVASNCHTRHVEGALSDLGVSGMFGSLVGMDRAGSKPDPGPVLLCMREMGADPASTLMVGDSASDVLAGLRAGIDAALVSRGGSPPAGCSPTFLISSLEDLLPRPPGAPGNPPERPLRIS
jgi:HAD superfamily hydrolase (TIGR01509 family)